MPERPATLVLSGGGAKGAFQVGAERVLRERGYRWQRIFGVSVGALNATLLAQEEYDRLLDVWRTIREQDVYRKFAWPVVAIRLAVLHKRGLYDNTPLRETIHKHAAGRPFRIPAHVGRVSLTTGAYELVSSDAPEFLDAVWESATMPVIWEPIGPSAYVDGGLRNVTPLGDALDSNPTEIVVIACSSATLDAVPPPGNILDAAQRSLTEITVNEILLNDVREFVRVNRLVRQAAQKGVTLTSEDGSPYRYCPLTVIEPPRPLGDTLDFSPQSVRMRLDLGAEAARSVALPAVVGPR